MPGQTRSMTKADANTDPEVISAKRWHRLPYELRLEILRLVLRDILELNLSIYFGENDYKKQREFLVNESLLPEFEEEYKTTEPFKAANEGTPQGGSFERLIMIHATQERRRWIEKVCKELGR